MNSDGRLLSFPHDKFTIEPDLILSFPLLSEVWEILISRPLGSNMMPHCLCGLNLFAYLNLLISFRFDFMVPWLKLILAIDIPASKTLIISIISDELGL